MTAKIGKSVILTLSHIVNYTLLIKQKNLKKYKKINNTIRSILAHK